MNLKFQRGDKPFLIYTLFGNAKMKKAKFWKDKKVNKTI